MFSKAQLDRYARHLLLPGVGSAGQRKLMEAKVLVVGAGGLGSPVLLYLAAAGVGTLGIIDFDVVELSNLQRQVLHSTPDVGRLKVESAAARLAALNPEVKVRLHPHKLDSESARALVRAYDLTIDGSDNLPTRYALNDACVQEGKPWLYGAISQFEGQLSLFCAPLADGMGPCYRCLYPEPPAGEVPSCAAGGVFGALPGVVGSAMALEAIKHLLNLGESLAGTLWHYDALYSKVHRVTLRRDPACAVCSDKARGQGAEREALEAGR
jgi:adenylyltransferase/sulfurtransferase